MKSKEEICGNWLQRYTKLPLEEFGDLILLTNFNNYVDMFCEQMKVKAVGFDANMRRNGRGHHDDKLRDGITQRGTHHGPPFECETSRRPLSG